MFSEPIAVDIIAYNVLTAIAASQEAGPTQREYRQEQALIRKLSVR
jgi:hypothetical protein